MKIKLKNPFKKAKEFIRTKKEAKTFAKAKAKSEEFKQYSDMMLKILRPQPISLAPGSSIATFDESNGGNTPVYFYDFVKEWKGNSVNDGLFLTGNFIHGDLSPAQIQDGVAFADMALDSNSSTMAIGSGIENIEPKVVIKPKDVFHELERLPDAIKMENLDEKITTFKMRQKFIKYNEYAKKEVMDMTVRLENRKKYEQFKEFYEKFDYTTTEKINALISKYDLVLKPSDLFIPTFPKEAIEIMNDYENKTIELCNKKPIFYVIAENSKFKKEFDRNDPILLAQSPFGIYWNILGAWDEEILLLEEL